MPPSPPLLTSKPLLRSHRLPIHHPRLLLYQPLHRAKPSSVPPPLHLPSLVEIHCSGSPSPPTSVPVDLYEVTDGSRSSLLLPLPCLRLRGRIAGQTSRTWTPPMSATSTPRILPRMHAGTCCLGSTPGWSGMLWLTWPPIIHCSGRALLGDLQPLCRSPGLAGRRRGNWLPRRTLDSHRHPSSLVQAQHGSRDRP